MKKGWAYVKFDKHKWDKYWVSLDTNLLKFCKSEEGKEKLVIPGLDLISVELAPECEFQPAVKLLTIDNEIIMHTETDEECDDWDRVISLYIGSNHKTQIQLLCTNTSDIAARRCTLLNETKDFIEVDDIQEWIRIDITPRNFELGNYNVLVAICAKHATDAHVKEMKKRIIEAQKARPKAMIVVMYENISHTILESLTKFTAEKGISLNPFGYGVTWRNFVDLAVRKTRMVTCARLTDEVKEKPAQYKSKFWPKGKKEAEKMHLKLHFFGEPQLISAHKQLMVHAPETPIYFEANEVKVDTAVRTGDDICVIAMKSLCDTPVLCCLNDSEKAIEYLEGMYNLIKNEPTVNPIVLLIRESSDSKVTYSDIQKFTREWKIDLIETSTETGRHLKELWNQGVRRKYRPGKIVNLQLPRPKVTLPEAKLPQKLVAPATMPAMPVIIDEAKAAALRNYKWNERDMDIGSLLTTSHSWIIYRAINRVTKIKCALKVPRNYESDEDKARVGKELGTLVDMSRNCKHGAIVYAYDICMYEGKTGIYMELLDMTLRQAMETPDKLNMIDRLIIAIGTCFGMRKLHQRGFVHHALDSDTIMIDHNKEPKITHFSDRTRDGLPSGPVLSNYVYTAAEILEKPDAGYSVLIDVYSFGFVLYELLAMKRIPEMDKETWTRKIVEENWRPEFPAQLDEGIATLIRRCWNKVPGGRPTVKDLADDLIRIAMKMCITSEDKERIEAYINKVEPDWEYTTEVEEEEDEFDITETGITDFNEADYEEKHVLGEGQFGRVVLVQSKRDNQLYALKKLKELPELMRYYFNREVEALSTNIHPCVVRLHALQRPNDKGEGACLVTEYVPGGDLQEALKTKSLNPTEKAIVAAGIVFGMASLHKRKFIHRDLKPANIMLDAHKHVKICDLGMARTEDLDMTQTAGTPLYMAPEMFCGDDYNHKVDVFSFSLILYEMLTGRNPTEGKTYRSPWQWGQFIMHKRPSINDVKIQAGRDLLEMCWDGNVDQRAEFTEVIQTMGQVRGHFLEGVNEEAFMKYYTSMMMYMLAEDVDESKYEVVKTLGEGSFGSVVLGKAEDGKLYAIKKLNDLTDDDKKYFNREVDALFRNNHPCIVKLHGVKRPSKDGSGAILVMEYLSGGDLQTALNNGGLTSTERAIIAAGIAFGMNSLHKRGFMHRDLKPANILLDEHKYPKVTDFGLAREEDESQQGLKTFNMGTPWYMAPEMMRTDAYDQKVDVYSFALILYQLVTGRHPSEGKRYNIFTWSKAITEGYRPSLDCVENDAICGLIDACWSDDPKTRIGFDEILYVMEQSRGAFIDSTVDEAIFMKYYNEMKEK